MLASGKLQEVETCRVTARYPDRFETLSTSYAWARISALQLLPGIVMCGCNISLIVISYQTYNYRRRLIGAVGTIMNVNPAFVVVDEKKKQDGQQAPRAEEMELTLKTSQEEPVAAETMILYCSSNNDNDINIIYDECNMFSIEHNTEAGYDEEAEGEDGRQPLATGIDNDSISISSRRNGSCRKQNGARSECLENHTEIIDRNLNDVNRVKNHSSKRERHNQVGDSNIIMLDRRLQNEDDVIVIYTHGRIIPQDEPIRCGDQRVLGEPNYTVASAGGCDEVNKRNALTESVDINIHSEQTQGNSDDLVSCSASGHISQLPDKSSEVVDNSIEKNKELSFSSERNNSLISPPVNDVQATANFIENPSCDEHSIAPASTIDSSEITLQEIKNRYDSIPKRKQHEIVLTPSTICNNNNNNNNQNNNNDKNNTQPDSESSSATLDDVIIASETITTENTTSPSSRSATSASPRRRTQESSIAELRPTIMLVLVTSCTLFAELMVTVALFINFMNQVVEQNFVREDSLITFIMVSNLITLMSFPVNFMFFCGLSRPFRNTLIAYSRFAVHKICRKRI